MLFFLTSSFPLFHPCLLLLVVNHRLFSEVPVFTLATNIQSHCTTILVLPAIWENATWQWQMCHAAPFFRQKRLFSWSRDSWLKFPVMKYESAFSFLRLEPPGLISQMYEHHCTDALKGKVIFFILISYVGINISYDILGCTYKILSRRSTLPFRASVPLRK